MQVDSISQRIAHFAVTTPTESIATDARRIAQLSLLDWLSVALAGRDEPVSRIVREMISAEGGAAQADVFGSTQQFPARAAALANGATSHALDYDDTHFIYIGHPSVAVFPAALAVAQQTNSSLADFLDAALLGMEAACRIGDWLGRSHYQHGFHQTSTSGCFGATVAAARLSGLSIEQTQHALGIAASRAAGLKAQFGTMGKPYHAGMAAASGVEAVQLAARGFIANPDALDTAQGFAQTHAAENKDASVLLDGLGQRYVFTQVQHKFHACCHGTHAMLEAANHLCAMHQPATEQIKTITIKSHPRWLAVCNIQSPQTGLEVKFSLRMTAALALLGYDTAALDTFTDDICVDPAVLAVCAKARVVGDDSVAEMQAQVELEMFSGEVLAADYDLDAPLAYEQREAKVRAKSAALIGRGKADALWVNIAVQNDMPMLVSDLTEQVFAL